MLRHPQQASGQQRLLAFTVFYVNLLSLACQLLWVRRLNTLFGSTAMVFSSVLSAFLLGLAAGAWFGGRRVERTARPWRLLGTLLTGIGLYAVASLWLFDGARLLYLAAAPAAATPLVSALGKLPFVLVLIVPPTFLIGAVLPVATALAARHREVGWSIAVLYGADTLGGACGAFLGGFVLVPQLGLAAASWLLGAGSLALGLWLVRRNAGSDSAIAVEPAPAPAEARRKARAVREPAVSAAPAELSKAAARATLVAYFFSGLAALLLETGWNRFFYLLNGTSIFSLSVVLTGFLVGIALGSFLIRRRLDRGTNLFALLAYLQLAAAVGGMLVFRAQEFFERRYLSIFASTDGYLGFQLQISLLVLLMVCVATLSMGASFPTVTRLFAASSSRAGSALGRVYLVNTAGAVCGALLGEFVLLPRFGFDGLMAVVSAIYVGSAVLFIFLAPRPTPWRHVVATSLLAIAALALTPPLRRFEPPSNAVYYTGVRRGTWTSFAALNAAQRTVWRRQGYYGQVAVLAARDGTIILKHNGKTDASSSDTDNFAQLMLGHVPLLLHPEAKNVLNIGLGGGMTLSAIEGHPTVEHVVQVEIDPLVVEAARGLFGAANRHALEDRRVELVIDDGRNYVERVDRRFDIIVSEPPNLWVSGVSGLFTEQFYRAARARLTPGGLLCQWLPLYELSEADLAVALRTIGGAFPHLRVWTNGSVALVIASDAAIPATAREGVPEAAVTDLGRVGIPAGQIASYLATPDLDDVQIAALVAKADAVNRDDRPVLEFRCARNLFLQSKDPRAADWRARLSRAR